MQTLDDLKIHLSPAKRHLLDKAFELGKEQLQTVLSQPAADTGFFANLPELPRSLAMQALLMELVSFQIPVHAHRLSGVDKMHIKRMQAQNATDRALLRDMLLRSVRFADNQNPAASFKLLMDELAAQLWEATDVLMRTTRPDEAVAVLKLYAAGEVYAQGDDIPLAAQPQPDLAA